MADLDKEFEQAVDLDAEFNAAQDLEPAMSPERAEAIATTRADMAETMRAAADIPDNPLAYMAQSAGRYIGDVATGEAPVTIPVVSPLLDKLRSDEELAWRQQYAEQHPERAAAGDILSSALVGGGIGKAAQVAAPMAGLGAGGTAVTEAGLNVVGNRALTAADVAAQGGSISDVAESQKGLTPALLDIASVTVPGARAAAPKIASVMTGKSVGDLTKYADSPELYKGARTSADYVAEAGAQADVASRAAEQAASSLPEIKAATAEAISTDLGNKLGSQFGQAASAKREAAQGLTITPEQLDDITSALGRYQDNPYVAKQVDKAISDLGPESKWSQMLDIIDQLKPEKYKGSRLGGAALNKEDLVRSKLSGDLTRMLPEQVAAEHAKIREMADAQKFMTEQAGLKKFHPESLSGKENIYKSAEKLIESESGNLNKALVSLDANEAKDALDMFKAQQGESAELALAAKDAARFSKESPTLLKRAFTSSVSQDVPGSQAASSRDVALAELSSKFDPTELERSRIAEVVSTPSGPRGSRLVNLLSAIGGLAGDPGRAIGAMTGGAADYAGSKGLLDATRAVDRATSIPLKAGVAASQAERRNQINAYLRQKYPDRFTPDMSEGEIMRNESAASFLEQDQGNIDRTQEKQ